MLTAISMRNRRNTAVNLLKDTFQILNRNLIDGHRCQLRRLNLFNHHYQSMGGVAHGVGMKRHKVDWGWQRHRLCNQPYLLMIGVRHKIVGMRLVEWNVMLTPTINSKKNKAGGHFPRCGDEAAQSGLGVAAPQAMQSAIAAGHHDVPFSLKYVIRKKMWSGQRLVRGLLAKPTTKQVMVYINFFVSGLQYPFYHETHCMLYLYLGRVLWASAAQLMSQQANSLKELTTSTYVV
jgi:hypothetical protein